MRAGGQMAWQHQVGRVLHQPLHRALPRGEAGVDLFAEGAGHGIAGRENGLAGGGIAQQHADRSGRVAWQMQDLQLVRPDLEALAPVQQEVHVEAIKWLVIQEAGARQVGVALRHGLGVRLVKREAGAGLFAQVPEGFHMVPVAVRADDQPDLARVSHRGQIGPQRRQAAVAAAIDHRALAGLLVQHKEARRVPRVAQVAAPDLIEAGQQSHGMRPVGLWRLKAAPGRSRAPVFQVGAGPVGHCELCGCEVLRHESLVS
jgi:hypothetical protein